MKNNGKERTEDYLATSIQRTLISTAQLKSQLIPVYQQMTVLNRKSNYTINVSVSPPQVKLKPCIQL